MKYLGRLKLDISVTKLILVVDHKLYLCDYEKKEVLLETDCYVGKNGFSNNRHTGDCTTPIGLFKIMYGFGMDELVLPNLEYKQIKDTSYFCDDENSKHYNSWVESNSPIVGEHLIDYLKEYQYGLVFDFNMNPKIKGVGSSIFLHCKGIKDYTLGCISIDNMVLYRILNLIDSNSYILVVPDKDYLEDNYIN